MYVLLIGSARIPRSFPLQRPKVRAIRVSSIIRALEALSRLCLCLAIRFFSRAFRADCSVRGMI